MELGPQMVAADVEKEEGGPLEKGVNWPPENPEDLQAILPKREETPQ